ncbi:MAG TPA: hypothetical protein VIE64_09335 [Solirubrobacterales bacterium]|jgi:hypothetical protein
MQDNPSSRGEDPDKPDRISDEEAKVGHAVLSLVVSLYPSTISIAELAHRLSKGPEDSTVERAIRDLASAGLLHSDGRNVLAAQIALALDRLRILPPIDPPPKPDQNGG